MEIRSPILALGMGALAARCLASTITVPNGDFETGNLDPWVANASVVGQGGGSPTLEAGVTSDSYSGIYGYRARASMAAQPPKPGQCTDNNIHLSLSMHQSFSLAASVTGPIALAIWLVGNVSQGDTSEMHARIGLDPTGSEDENGLSVVWTEVTAIPNARWVRQILSLPPTTSNTFTVFIQGYAEVSMRVCNASMPQTLTATLRVDSVHMATSLDQPPVIVLTDPTNGAPMIQPYSLTFNVTDPESEGMTVNLYRDGEKYQSPVTTTGGDVQFTNIMAGYGIHQYELTVTDDWDNTSTSGPVYIESMPEAQMNLYTGPTGNASCYLLKTFGQDQLIGVGGFSENGVGRFAVLRFDRRLNTLQENRYTCNLAGKICKPVDMIVHPDGSKIVAVNSSVSINPQSADAYVLDIGPNGVEQWRFVFDGTPEGSSHPADDQPTNLARDGNGNIYLFGKSALREAPYTIRDFLLKLDAQGNEVWRTFILPDDGYHLTPVQFSIGSDGKIYLASTTGSNSDAQRSQVSLTAVNPTGTIAWTQEFTSRADRNETNGIVADGEGNVYVAASCPGENGLPDIYTLKYNSEGSLLWARSQNGIGNADDTAGCITIASDGGILVGGNYWVSSSYGYDLVVIKYDNDGQQQWVAQDKNPEIWDTATAIFEDGSGKIHLLGSDNNSPALVFKSSLDGQVLESRTLTGIIWNKFYARSMAVFSDGDAYVTGAATGNQQTETMKTIRVPASARYWFGQVDLAAYTGSLDGLEAEFASWQGGQKTESRSASLSALGNYSVLLEDGLSERLTLKPTHWLSVATPVDQNSGPRLDWTIPYNGDATGDNRIALPDLNQIFVNFALNDPNSDMDGSGTVDVPDINIIVVNFGLTGEE